MPGVVAPADSPVTKYASDNQVLQKQGQPDHILLSLKNQKVADYAILVVQYEFTHGLAKGNANVMKVRHNAAITEGDYNNVLKLIGAKAGDPTLVLTYVYINLDRIDELGWNAAKVNTEFKAGLPLIIGFNIAGKMAALKKAKASAGEFFLFTPAAGGGFDTQFFMK